MPPTTPRILHQPRRAPTRLLATMLVAACVTPAASGFDYRRSLADLSLEELMNETVTSVSKREQKLSDTASAVTVLSHDDIHRSGATTIADALRLVPGMNVASVSSSQWAVSARGFNGIFANKLLVMVDGRAVYSPLFAGVHWDSILPVLEDVDRVEVIRGPGATVWGANAVNGVINIVSRDARDTQGGLLYGSAGDVEKFGYGARYGGRLGERTYYRVYAGAMAKDDYRLADGSDADDSWRARQGGVRVDHHPSETTQLTWQAETTGTEADNGTNDTLTANTLARLTKRWSERSTFEVQTYYSQGHYDELARSDARVDTFDLGAQHTFGLGERHDVIWGAGYRFSEIRLKQNNVISLVRDDEVEASLVSFFVQDEYHVVPDRFSVTGGVKLEHNTYTGFEVQPSLRAVFKPTPNQSIWAAVSRAVRTPSALESEDIFAIAAGAPFPGPGGVYVPRIVGNPDMDSEELVAYELGYRVQPMSRVNLDIALFYNAYDSLVTLGGVSRLVPGVPVGTAELPFLNTQDGGETYGGEVAATVSPADSWRLSASYSLLFVSLPGSAPSNPYERGTPRNQAVLRSSHDLGRQVGVDAQLRYVDNIQSVSSYLTADLRLSYRPTDRMEFALVGQNLLQDQHAEQAPFYLTPVSEVPRSFHAKFTWRF